MDDVIVFLEKEREYTHTALPKKTFYTFCKDFQTAQTHLFCFIYLPFVSHTCFESAFNHNILFSSPSGSSHCQSYLRSSSGHEQHSYNVPCSSNTLRFYHIHCVGNCAVGGELGGRTRSRVRNYC